MTYETYGYRRTAPEIRRFLEHHELSSYCDACLARRFDVAIDEVRTITRALTTGTGFVRQNRPCAACSQIAVTTSVGIKLRPA